ncbi:DegT/DnrJ/EryC1/StrS family aminotransferase [Lysinibacillus fusiformis]|nr:DegT/DnrJ/EryC1/StrS family aminotransferase [Lysinibacillus fusiformis]
MDAYDSSWISSTGKYIDLFEGEFANYIGAKFGVAMSNGTTALHAALEALGIGESDEVIVPDLTFAATVNVVLHAGAVPVIVDVNESDWCICPKSIEKAITSKTKAIIPVHLYGMSCDMDAIMEIAERYELYVIEDCAEAHGASYKGEKVGSIGHVGCFSFFGNKIITTGEGGMCLTNNKDLEEKLRILRDHGMSKKKKYFHESIGYNYRMTNIQAAVGVAQLQKIEYILAEREKISQLYMELLQNVDGVYFQMKYSDIENINWLFSIVLEGIDRDCLIDRLKEYGVDSRPFFYPLSQMPIYKKYAKNINNSVIVSEKGLNLPTYVGLTERDIIHIAKSIKKIINEIRCL